MTTSRIYRGPEAVRLAKDKRWDELVSLVRGPRGPAWANLGERGGCGKLALHYAVHYGAPVEVVRLLLDVCPQGAQVTDDDGDLALHLAARNQPQVEVGRALLDAYPQGAQVTDDDGDLALHLAAEADGYCPKNHVMLALAHEGYLPSHPWTPETCAALRRIAAYIDRPEVRALIDAHLSRVRTLLRAFHRRCVPSELLPLLVGPVYSHDFFR